MGALTPLLGDLDEVVASTPPSPDRAPKPDSYDDTHVVESLYHPHSISSMDSLVTGLMEHARGLQAESDKTIDEQSQLISKRREYLLTQKRSLEECNGLLALTQYTKSELEEHTDLTQHASATDGTRYEKACEDIESTRVRMGEIQGKIKYLEGEISRAEDTIQGCIAINEKIKELQALLERAQTIHEPLPTETILPLQENEWLKIYLNPTPNIDYIAEIQDYSDLLTLLKEYARTKADYGYLEEEYSRISASLDEKRKQLSETAENIRFLEELSQAEILLPTQKEEIAALLKYFKDLQKDLEANKTDDQSRLESAEKRLQENERGIQEAAAALSGKLEDQNFEVDINNPKILATFSTSLNNTIEQIIIMAYSPKKAPLDSSAKATPARPETPLWESPLSRTPSEADDRPGSNLGRYFPQNAVFSPIAEQENNPPFNSPPVQFTRNVNELNGHKAYLKSPTPLANMQAGAQQASQVMQPQILPQVAQIIQMAQPQAAQVSAATTQHVVAQQQLLGEASVEDHYEAIPADDEFAEELGILMNIQPSKAMIDEREDVRVINPQNIPDRKIVIDAPLEEIATPKEKQKTPKTSATKLVEADDIDHKNNKVAHKNYKHNDDYIPNDKVHSTKPQEGETITGVKAEHHKPKGTEDYFVTRRHRGKAPLSAVL